MAREKVWVAEKRVPGAVQRSSRCSAEPGPITAGPRFSSAALRAAQYPGHVDRAGNTSEHGVQQPTEPDPASPHQAGGRQHAVTGFQRAGAEPDAACQGIGADLLARHDGQSVRDRLRSRPGRRALRRDALRQGGARAAAPGARHRGRRPVHRRHHRAELEQGAQHPAAAVRQPRHAVLSPEHGRHRRPTGEEVGAAERRRRDRRGSRHDRADARHDRLVRLRLPFQFVLPARLSPVRRIADALA
jgi:hypothetical protein